MKLDGFQKVAVGRCVSDLEASGNALLVAPTGAGKTVMMAAVLKLLANRRPQRVLVLQHTVTLWDQNARELKRFIEGLGLNVGVLGAGRAKGLANADVVVGTVQTVGSAHGEESWLDHLKPFDLVVIDEAHHAAAPSYVSLLAQTEARNPARKVFGLTATPERPDGKGLGVFSQISHQVTFEDVIRAGRVVPPRVLTAQLDSVDALGSRQWTDGEDEAWSATARKAVVIDEIVRKHLALWEGRTGVYFCANIAHAEDLAQAFSGAGLRAGTVSHKMRPKAVREITEALGRGEIDVLTNPVMLTEGFNCPRVSLVGLARGFASKSLMIQAVGRGLRAAEGKRDGLVLDFVQALPTHGDLFPGLNIEGRSRKAGGAGRDVSAPQRPQIEVHDVALAEFDALNGLLDRVTPGNVQSLQVSQEGDAQVTVARTRKEALALGLPTYFTGKPCKRGHVGERFAVDSKCMECDRERYQAPEVKARRLARNQDPEVKARNAARTREWRKDPEVKARNAALQRERCQDPEVRARNAALQRERCQDPEVKARKLARQREWYRKNKAARERDAQSVA